MGIIMTPGRVNVWHLVILSSLYFPGSEMPVLRGNCGAQSQQPQRPMGVEVSIVPLVMGPGLRC